MVGSIFAHLIMKTLIYNIRNQLSIAPERGRKTYLVEPAGGQDSTRREHDAQCQHIDRRLVREQEIRFDAVGL